MHSISSTLIWVQNKSVLILQITARKKNANQTSALSSHQVPQYLFPWMSFLFHECVPITVAHDVLLFLCCLWSFVFQWWQNTHCRTVSYVSYMLQIHIRLSFSDLVFKVVLCWYQNSCIVSMLHLNSTTTNVLFCMNVICLLFS